MYNVPMALHKAFSLKMKISAVKAYLTGDSSLRTVAKQHKVSYRTLSYWVNQYKHKGKDGLIEVKTRHRRLPKEIETQVMFLKEQNPALSVSKAQKLLKRKKITLSRRLIWQVWQVYGLSKKSLTAPLETFSTPTKETTKQLKQARTLVKKGDIQSAAQLLNALPCMPRDPLIKEIPEKMLAPRRRLDRLSLEMGTMPWRDHVKRSRRVAAILEQKGFLYSSIIAHFYELSGLNWLSKPTQSMQVLELLKRKMKYINNSALWFLFHTYQTAAFCDTLQINKAYSALEKCRRLIYHLPDRHVENFGALLTVLGKSRDAVRFYTKALRRTRDKDSITRLNLRLGVQCFAMTGEYSTCKRILAKAQLAEDTVGFRAIRNLGRALVAFGQGNMSEASKYYLKALETASKEELLNLLYATAAGLATVAMALNNKKTAFVHLSKYVTLMKKHGLVKETIVLTQLLGSDEPLTQEIRRLPPFCLLNLLVRARETQRSADYHRALKYAQKQKLLGLFHRWSVFFPEPVIHLLQRGKKTGLPKAVVNLPVFNRDIPVYHVKFLGRVVISKNNQYVRAKPSPQDTAFLIHLALRAGAPGQSIPARDLYQNFWRQSEKPMERLLHLLVRIKKLLMLPSHLLAVSSASGEPRLANRGFYITTDYAEFGTLLTQVKTLKKAGEWPYARRDYLRAFALLRGEPLRKMYDDWSEHLRHTILNRVENEVINFTNGCLNNDNKQDAYRTLTKVQTITPHSQDVKQLIEQVAQ